MDRVFPTTLRCSSPKSNQRLSWNLPKDSVGSVLTVGAGVVNGTLGATAALGLAADVVVPAVSVEGISSCRNSSVKSINVAP